MGGDLSEGDDPSEDDRHTVDWTDDDGDYPEYPVAVNSCLLDLPTQGRLDDTAGVLENSLVCLAANYRSILKDVHLAQAIDRCGAPLPYRFRLPGVDEKIYQTPPVDGEPGWKWWGISIKAFDCGFRLPLNPLCFEIFRMTGMAIGQLHVNGFIHINSFLAHCLRRRVKPSMFIFWYIFQLVPHQHSGFYTLVRRARSVEQEWASTFNNVHKWQRRWLYVAGPDLNTYPCWSFIDHTVFKPSVVSEDDFRFLEIFGTRKGREGTWSTGRIGSDEFLIKYRVMAPHRKPSVQDLVSGALTKKKKRGKASTSDVAPKKSRVADPRRREYDSEERCVADEVQQPQLNSVVATGVTRSSSEPRRWVPDLDLTYEDSIYEGPRAGKAAIECLKVFRLHGDRRCRPVHTGPDKMAEATARSLAQACEQFHDAASYYLEQLRDQQRLKESFGKNLMDMERLQSSLQEMTLKSAEERRVSEAQVLKMGRDLEAMKRDVEKLGPLTDKYDRSLKKVKQLRMRAKRLKELGSLTAGFVYREVLGKLRDSGIDHKPFLPDPEEDFLEIPLVEPPPDDEETIQLSDAGESESETEDEEEDDGGDDGGEGGGVRPTDLVA